MDAFISTQPSTDGAGQPQESSGAAAVQSPQVEQESPQQQQQQPTPSGTAQQVAGAAPGKNAKTSPVWLYFKEFPPKENGKNVKCTVWYKVPATQGLPERDIECGMMLTFRRQSATTKGSGTSGMLNHLKRKHNAAFRDVQERSRTSATTKMKLGDIYHGAADGGAIKKRSIEAHFHRKMSQKERDEHHRRYVIFCALEATAFPMSSGDAFRYFIGGLSPSYASETIHHDTINKHLVELATEVKTAITVKLKAQHDSAMKLGWYGPFVGLQTDLTTAFNTEYITFTLSFVSDDWCMERVTICTKAFPGKHSQEEIGLWVRKITKDVFQPVLGDGNDCEPSDIYIGATVDQGHNFINALESIIVPVNVCYAHKLNTVVGWGLGINGSASTCKNPSARKLMNKAAAMVGHFSHSAVNNDAFKDVQRDMDELEGILGLVRRNDTRWGSQHAMMLRMIKLHKPLQAYFADRINGRELQSSEWRAVRQLVSVLDPAAAVTTQIQGVATASSGRQSMTSPASLLDGTQEIRDLNDPDNGPRTARISRLPSNKEAGEVIDCLPDEAVATPLYLSGDGRGRI